MIYIDAPAQSVTIDLDEYYYYLLISLRSDTHIVSLVDSP
jgi:hypothetical protein